MEPIRPGLCQSPLPRTPCPTWKQHSLASRTTAGGVERKLGCGPAGNLGSNPAMSSTSWVASVFIRWGREFCQPHRLVTRNQMQALHGQLSGCELTVMCGLVGSMPTFYAKSRALVLSTAPAKAWVLSVCPVNAGVNG